MSSDENPISDHPEQNSILTTGLRGFLDSNNGTEVSDDTRYTYRKRIKERINSAMWDFGLLLWSDENIYQNLNNNDVSDKPENENNHTISLEGFSDHVANAIGFLYLAVPFQVFKRAIETGIFRAEHEANDRRMLSVSVDISREYAPTQENRDKYDIEAIRTKLTQGEELTQLERMALAEQIDFYSNSQEVADDESTYSHRSDE